MPSIRHYTLDIWYFVLSSRVTDETNIINLISQIRKQMLREVKQLVHVTQLINSGAGSQTSLFF